MEIAIGCLSFIIFVQLCERYYYSKDMNQKLQDCIKAVMSRNVAEFVQATRPKEKEEKEPLLDQLDVLLSDADDKTFDKHISDIAKG